MGSKKYASAGRMAGTVRINTTFPRGFMCKVKRLADKEGLAFNEYVVSLWHQAQAMKVPLTQPQPQEK